MIIEPADGVEGGLVLRSPEPLGPFPPRVGDYLVRWAKETPERTFLAERDDEGGWRVLTYGKALEHARSVGHALLDLGLHRRPLMILSGNDIGHAIVQLGAMHVGTPAAPISPAYSLVSQDYSKLRHVFNVVRPGTLYVSNERQFVRALDALDLNPRAPLGPAPRDGRTPPWG